MSEPELNKSIFRAYDIRGKVGSELDVPTARKIGRALATKGMSLGVSRIAIGRDGRTSSPELAAALASGINDESLDTLDLGMVTSPMAYWAAKKHTGGSCAMVTGSHNPKEYNGIKMMLAGETLAGEEVQQLRILIEEGRFAGTGVTGVKEQIHIEQDYEESLLEGHKLARPIDVVVDCGNGVTGLFAAKTLQKLGCVVTALFTEVDGDFPNHHPDPAVPENYSAAREAMKQNEAELAIAFDGDGDRLGVWLPKSGMAYPDRILMLLTRELLSRMPGATVLYDVKCSVNFAPFASELGGKPVMIRTGHSFMKKELSERNAPLGGELSGHFFFNEGEWKFDDAMLAVVKLLEIVSQASSAEELFATVPDSQATPEYKVDISPEIDAQSFVANLAEPANFPGHRELNKTDGVRVEWEDGFGLLRPSNTTPSLILRFEGQDESGRDRIIACFRDCLLRADPQLRLPF